MNDFAGRHVLVTGASSGIGLATARLLAARGARVSLIARRIEALAEAERDIAEAGGIGCGFVADVADPLSQDAAFAAAVARFGPVDALFANAGTGGRFLPITDYPDELFASVLTTNVTAVFRAIKRVLPAMIERRHGAILVTGSLASERGMADNAGYVASKHAVLGLARAAAIEAAPHGVRVNCVIPGLIETPMLTGLAPEGGEAALMRQMGGGVPQGRVGSAGELAEVAAFLLSDAASHVTGQALAVDGGILGTLVLR